MKIKNVIGREVLDSRGNPTIEVEILIDGNKSGRAIVPSGASTGTKEALELRDNDLSRFGGKGVLKAVKNVNEIIKKEIIGLDIEDQKFIDNRLLEIDNTDNKKNLGANAILGVSLATAHCRAVANKIPLFKDFNKSKELKYNLPIPFMNILNGTGSESQNNVVCANAGVAISTSKGISISEGFEAAKESLKSGKALNSFNKLKKIMKWKF